MVRLYVNLEKSINFILGVVIDGQNTLDNLYKGYGDIPPFGNGPDQQKIHNRGNAYIRENFPKTDFLLHCEMVVKEPPVVAIQPPPEEPEPQKEEPEVVIRKEVSITIISDGL